MSTVDRAAAERHAQRGVVLIFSLVVLLILAIGAVAMLRSVNTSLVSAGNLAFHRDLVNQGEQAVATVVSNFKTNAAPLNGATTADMPAANYVSTILPTNTQGVPLALLNQTTFNTVGQSSNDILGATPDVTIRYIIDRLCSTTGIPASTTCVQSYGLPTGGTANRNTAVAPPSATVYRVSVRVTGPRNTQAFLQSSLHQTGLIMNGVMLRHLAIHLALVLGFAYTNSTQAQTTLADKPIAAGANVPGNLALTLSVEYPTAISIANIGAYADSSTFLGYFDPAKCYTYLYNAATPGNSYFSPTSLATGSNGHSCPGYWSGNFMNWATMQTIDPFRWALTGGYRSVDTTSQTILEKAWGSTQGSASANFPYRGTSYSGNNNLPNSLVAQVTPFNNWLAFNTGIWGNGNTMVFSGGVGYVYSYTSPLVLDLGSPLSTIPLVNTVAGALLAYKVYIRVAVCDATLGTAMLESNCVQYGNNYKPQGLLQQYSQKFASVPSVISTRAATCARAAPCASRWVSSDHKSRSRSQPRC